MNKVRAAIAWPLLAVTLAAAAHEGEDHGRKAAAPATREQRAWGIAGDAKEAQRTIEVRMTDDMRFVPALVDVRQGETVRFLVRNDGQVLHEMVIATRLELDAHAALMMKFPTMEHDEPHMTHVRPGKAGEIVWTFNRAGSFDFACLIAGHYQAGMVGRIVVHGRAAATR